MAKSHEWIKKKRRVYKVYHRHIVSTRSRRRSILCARTQCVTRWTNMYLAKPRPPPRRVPFPFLLPLSLFLSHLHARDSGGCFSWLYGVLWRIHLSACIACASRLGERDRIATRTRGKSDGRELFSSVTCVGVKLRQGAHAQLRSWASRSTWSPPATIPRYCRLPTFRT